MYRTVRTVQQANRTAFVRFRVYIENQERERTVYRTNRVHRTVITVQQANRTAFVRFRVYIENQERERENIVLEACVQIRQIQSNIENQ